MRTPSAASQSGPAELKPTAAAALHRVYLTARGALILAFAVCLIGCLIAAWRQLDMVAGLGFCLACLLASALVRPAALPQVVIAPPALFLLALVVSEALTAQGTSSRGSMLSVLEGVMLTLAAVAPWLFGGTAAGVAVAMVRGLPHSFRELRSELSDDKTSGS